MFIGKGFGRRTSLSDNARYPGIVKIGYPLHPLFGQEVRAIQLDAKGREGQLLIEGVDDRRCLPFWMTDPARCALLTWGWQPFASCEALRQLDELLASLDRHDPQPRLDS